MTEDSPKALVVIPTYNEIDNIDGIINAVLDLPRRLDILIIDDGSPDGTGGYVKEHFGNDPRVNLIERSGKKGLGTAYVAGFRYALERDYPFIMEMDADFSHDPKDLVRLLDSMPGNDLVIGSRYLNRVTVVNWPLRRLLLSMGASLYARLITGLKIKDTTAGFKCFRRNVLESIDLDRIRSNGYAFQIEMHYKTWKKGFRIKEIPIVFTDRHDGQSKMGGAIIREAIFVVWKLRFGRL
jgi:dolichol-phosphate mannosyltransferase